MIPAILQRPVAVADVGLAAAVRAAGPVHDPDHIVDVGEIGIVPPDAVVGSYREVHCGAQGRPLLGGSFEGLDPVRIAEVVHDYQITNRPRGPGRPVSRLGKVPRGSVEGPCFGHRRERRPGMAPPGA